MKCIHNNLIALFIVCCSVIPVTAVGSTIQFDISNFSFSVASQAGDTLSFTQLGTSTDGAMSDPSLTTGTVSYSIYGELGGSILSGIGGSTFNGTIDLDLEWHLDPTDPTGDKILAGPISTTLPSVSFTNSDSTPLTVLAFIEHIHLQWGRRTTSSIVGESEIENFSFNDPATSAVVEGIELTLPTSSTPIFFPSTTGSFTDGSQITTISAVVPLPGAFWLFGSGLLALFGINKKLSLCRKH